MSEQTSRNKQTAFAFYELMFNDCRPREAIEQFSDAFFKLAASQSAEQNQFLTFAEPVVVKLQGKVYRIDVPRP